MKNWTVVAMCFGVVLTLEGPLLGATIPEKEPFPMPPWAEDIFFHSATLSRFDIMYLYDIILPGKEKRMNLLPWFIEGDFNHDNLPDVAVRAFDREAQTYGFLVAHQGENKIYAVGFFRLDIDDPWKTYRYARIGSRPDKTQGHMVEIQAERYEADLWRWNGHTYRRVPPEDR